MPEPDTAVDAIRRGLTRTDDVPIRFDGRTYFRAGVGPLVSTASIDTTPRLPRMLERQSLDIGGVRIDTHASGSGRLAVFIHGFPLDHRMWRSQLFDLAGRRQCVAVDLRGHGTSPWAGDEIHTMELMAGDVAGVIETLSLEGADVVALSMGGYVALALAESRPELVRSLVLIDTRSTADPEPAREARDAMANLAVEEGRTRIASDMLPRLVAPDAELAVRGRIRTMIESVPVESMVADLRGMRDRPDRTSVLEGLDLPVGILVGADDVLTPPETAEHMARAAGVEVQVIQGAGHMAPMERPEEVSQAVRALWSEA